LRSTAVRRDAPSDEQVIERVRAGEVALFEVLMRRHNQSVYRVVRSVLRDEAEAEDAMQQAYVAAFEHLHQFAGDARFATWLSRIALNEALGRRRRQSRFVDIEALGEDEQVMVDEREPGPERRAQAHELRQVLESAVDGLPDRYRVTFMLRDVEEMDTAEAAATLGVSEDVVKTRLHRARQMLRDRVYDRVGAGAAAAFTFEAPRCDRVVAAVLHRIAR
jgi:RNA polymerase sigma-70 factor (ECF subfamily)